MMTPQSTSTHPVVLIVDDEPGVRSTLRRLLGAGGWEALVAASAGDALAMLEDARVDVVLSDYLMPEAHGLHLLEEVARRFPHVRRVLMSGSPPEGIERRAGPGLAVEAFLPKPWDPVLVDGLLARMREGAGAPAANDLRRDARVPVSVRVSAEGDAWGPAQLDACDLSRGGAYLESDRPPEVGASLQVRIPTPAGVAVRVRGRVAHVVGGDRARRLGRTPGFGVAFVDMDAGDRPLLDRMVQGPAAPSDLPGVSPRSATPSGVAIADPRYVRALSLLAARKTAAAVDLLSDLCREAPSQPRYAARLETARARLACEQGREADAVRHYRRALDHEPGCREAVAVLRRAGDRVRAGARATPIP